MFNLFYKRVLGTCFTCLQDKEREKEREKDHGVKRRGEVDTECMW